jgi:hypothetical protein
MPYAVHQEACGTHLERSCSGPLQAQLLQQAKLLLQACHLPLAADSCHVSMQTLRCASVARNGAVSLQYAVMYCSICQTKWQSAARGLRRCNASVQIFQISNVQHDEATRGQYVMMRGCTAQLICAAQHM